MSDADLRWYAEMRKEFCGLRDKLSELIAAHRRHSEARGSVAPDETSQREWNDIKAVALQIAVLREMINTPLSSKESHAS